MWFINVSDCILQNFRIQLAEAGFYFAGDKNEPDVVECFLCEKSLDGWDATDDPWMEHTKHSRDCRFAQLMSAEGSLTYYQFLDIKAELIKNIYNKAFDAEETKIKSSLAEIRKYVSRYFKWLADNKCYLVWVAVCFYLYLECWCVANKGGKMKTVIFVVLLLYYPARGN